jgi:hypothetical protein
VFGGLDLHRPVLVNDDRVPGFHGVEELGPERVDSHDAFTDPVIGEDDTAGGGGVDGVGETQRLGCNGRGVTLENALSIVDGNAMCI